MKYWIMCAIVMTAWIDAHGEPLAVLKTSELPEQGETRVWSPLFQASWDKMNCQYAGKPTKVVPPNPFIDWLNQYKWNQKEVMPPEGYAVYAGSDTAEFAEETAKDIKQKFGIQMTPSTLPRNSGATALYAILVRNLEFKKQFYRSRKKPLSFLDSTKKVHKVHFFGVAGDTSNDYGNNVRVLTYNKGGASFILSMATNRPGEQILIYKPGRLMTFDMGIEHILQAKKTPLAGPTGSLTDSYLHKNDVVIIPYLSMKLRTDFSSQLQGLRHYEGEKLPFRVNRAYQITHFDLFEKGARIRVETHHDSVPFGGGPVRKQKILYIPRKFICEEPFFVFAWRDKAPLPYFAAWIDGKDALLPFPR